MHKILNKTLAIILSILLVIQQTGFAQAAVAELNVAGHLASLRSTLLPERFRPLHLRYIAYDSLNNNFKLLLDKGDQFKGQSPSGTVPNTSLESTTKDLLTYFFTGITLPNEAFWVNLRPDSPNDTIDPLLAQTEAGRILLEADLQLKKDTAKATSPNTLEGKEYWDKLYQKAEELYGSQNITIPTLTRPWIVPDEIIIRESTDSAYVYKATLKVMLEQDYLKDSSTYSFKDPREKALNEYSSKLIREKIIPKLTREINSSKRYAPLRQVYYSLILAQWFKSRNQGQSPAGTVPDLIDSRNLSNLQAKTPYSVETYFKAYKENFEQGEYNTKQPIYTPYGQSVRSYFSGGMSLSSLTPTSIAPVPAATGNSALINNPYLAAAEGSITLGELVVKISNTQLSEDEVKKRVQAIEAAHQIEPERQLGEQNSDGTYEKYASDDSEDAAQKAYTPKGIAKKAKTLRDAGFSKEQRQGLLKYGLAGNASSAVKEGAKGVSWLVQQINLLEKDYIEKAKQIAAQDSQRINQETFLELDDAYQKIVKKIKDCARSFGPKDTAASELFDFYLQELKTMHDEVRDIFFVYRAGARSDASLNDQAKAIEIWESWLNNGTKTMGNISDQANLLKELKALRAEVKEIENQLRIAQASLENSSDEIKRKDAQNQLSSLQKQKMIAEATLSALEEKEKPSQQQIEKIRQDIENIRNQMKVANSRLKESSSAQTEERKLVNKLQAQASQEWATLSEQEEEFNDYLRRRLVHAASYLNGAFRQRLYAQVFLSDEDEILKEVMRSKFYSANVSQELMEAAINQIIGFMRMANSIDYADQVFGRGEIASKLETDPAAEAKVSEAFGKGALSIKRKTELTQSSARIGKTVAALAIVLLVAIKSGIGIQEKIQENKLKNNEPVAQVAASGANKNTVPTPKTPKAETANIAPRQEVDLAGIINDVNKASQVALSTNAPSPEQKAKLESLNKRRKELEQGLTKVAEKKKALTEENAKEDAKLEEQMKEQLQGIASMASKLPLSVTEDKKNTVRGDKPGLSDEWRVVNRAAEGKVPESLKPTEKNSPQGNISGQPSSGVGEQFSNSKVTSGGGNPEVGAWVADVQGGNGYLSRGTYTRINPQTGEFIAQPAQWLSWPLKSNQQAKEYMVLDFGKLSEGQLLVPPGYVVVNVSIKGKGDINNSVAVYYDNANGGWFLKFDHAPGAIRVGIRPQSKGELTQPSYVPIDAKTKAEWLKSLPPQIAKMLTDAQGLSVEERQNVRSEIMKRFYYTTNPLLDKLQNEEPDFIKFAFTHYAGKCDLFAFVYKFVSDALDLEGVDVQHGYKAEGVVTTADAHAWNSEGGRLVEPTTMSGGTSPLYGKSGVSPETWKQEFNFIKSRLAQVKRNQQRTTDTLRIDREERALKAQLQQADKELELLQQQRGDFNELEYYTALLKEQGTRLGQINFDRLSDEQIKGLIGDCVKQAELMKNNFDPMGVFGPEHNQLVHQYMGNIRFLMSLLKNIEMRKPNLYQAVAEAKREVLEKSMDMLGHSFTEPIPGRFPGFEFRPRNRGENTYWVIENDNPDRITNAPRRLRDTLSQEVYEIPNDADVIDYAPGVIVLYHQKVWEKTGYYSIIGPEAKKYVTDGNRFNKLKGFWVGANGLWMYLAEDELGRGYFIGPACPESLVTNYQNEDLIKFVYADKSNLLLLPKGIVFICGLGRGNMGYFDTSGLGQIGFPAGTSLKPPLGFADGTWIGLATDAEGKKEYIGTAKDTIQILLGDASNIVDWKQTRSGNLAVITRNKAGQHVLRIVRCENRNGKFASNVSATPWNTTIQIASIEEAYRDDLVAVKHTDGSKSFGGSAAISSGLSDVRFRGIGNFEGSVQSDTKGSWISVVTLEERQRLVGSAVPREFSEKTFDRIPFIRLMPDGSWIAKVHNFDENQDELLGTYLVNKGLEPVKASVIQSVWFMRGVLYISVKEGSSYQVLALTPGGTVNEESLTEMSPLYGMRSEAIDDAGILFYPTNLDVGNDLKAFPLTGSLARKAGLEGRNIPLPRNIEVRGVAKEDGTAMVKINGKYYQAGPSTRNYQAALTVEFNEQSSASFWSIPKERLDLRISRLSYLVNKYYQNRTPDDHHANKLDAEIHMELFNLVKDIAEGNEISGRYLDRDALVNLLKNAYLWYGAAENDNKSFPDEFLTLTRNTFIILKMMDRQDLLLDIIVHIDNSNPELAKRAVVDLGLKPSEWISILDKRIVNMKNEYGVFNSGSGYFIPSVLFAKKDRETIHSINTLLRQEGSKGKPRSEKIQEFSLAMERLVDAMERLNIPGEEMPELYYKDLEPSFQRLRESCWVPDRLFDQEVHPSQRLNPAYKLTQLLRMNFDIFKLRYGAYSDKAFDKDNLDRWNQINSSMNDTLSSLSHYQGRRNAEDVWKGFWGELSHDALGVAFIIGLVSLLLRFGSENLKKRDIIVGKNAQDIIDQIWIENPWFTPEDAQGMRDAFSRTLKSGDPAQINALRQNLDPEQRMLFDLLSFVAVDPVSPEPQATGLLVDDDYVTGVKKERILLRLLNLVPFISCLLVWYEPNHRMRQSFNMELLKLIRSMNKDKDTISTTQLPMDFIISIASKIKYDQSSVKNERIGEQLTGAAKRSSKSETDDFYARLREIIITFGSFAKLNSVKDQEAPLNPMELGEKIKNAIIANKHLSIGEVLAYLLRPNGWSIKKAGQGGEFFDLRSYQVGDDSRKIDWKASARSGNMVTRETETDVTKKTSILIDMRTLFDRDYSEAWIDDLAKSIIAVTDNKRVAGKHILTLHELVFVMPDGSIETVRGLNLKKTKLFDIIRSVIIPKYERASQMMNKMQQDGFYYMEFYGPEQNWKVKDRAQGVFGLDKDLQRRTHDEIISKLRMPGEYVFCVGVREENRASVLEGLMENRIIPLFWQGSKAKTRLEATNGNHATEANVSNPSLDDSPSNSKAKVVAGQEGTDAVGKTVSIAGLSLAEPGTFNAAGGTYHIDASSEIVISDLHIAVRIASDNWFNQYGLAGNGVVLAHKGVNGQTEFTIVLRENINHEAWQEAISHEFLAALSVAGAFSTNLELSGIHNWVEGLTKTGAIVPASALTEVQKAKIQASLNRGETVVVATEQSPAEAVAKDEDSLFKQISKELTDQSIENPGLYIATKYGWNTMRRFFARKNYSEVITAGLKQASERRTRPRQTSAKLTSKTGGSVTVANYLALERWKKLQDKYSRIYAKKSNSPFWYADIGKFGKKLSLMGRDFDRDGVLTRIYLTVPSATAPEAFDMLCQKLIEKGIMKDLLVVFYDSMYSDQHIDDAFIPDSIIIYAINRPEGVLTKVTEALKELGEQSAKEESKGRPFDLEPDELKQANLEVLGVFGIPLSYAPFAYFAEVEADIQGDQSYRGIARILQQELMGRLENISEESLRNMARKMASLENDSDATFIRYSQRKKVMPSLVGGEVASQSNNASGADKIQATAQRNQTASEPSVTGAGSSKIKLEILDDVEKEKISLRYGNRLFYPKGVRNNTIILEGDKNNQVSNITLGEPGEIISEGGAAYCNYIVIFDSKSKRAVLIHTSNHEDKVLASRTIKKALSLLSPAQPADLVAFIFAPNVFILGKNTEAIHRAAIDAEQIPRLETDWDAAWRFSNVRFLPDEGIALALSSRDSTITRAIRISNLNRTPPAVDKSSTPQNSKATGGIDFRFLPIVTQSMESLKLSIRAIPQSSIQRINLTKEWSDIESLVNSGINPSTERLKEYVAASSLQGSLDQDMDKIISCISDILRMEEESCCPTDPTLRDILVVLGSGKNGAEIEMAFSS